MIEGKLKVKKNFLFMSFTLFLRLFTNVIIFIILARLWSVGDFGKFMYAFTLSTLFVLIVDYGFSLKLVKDISLNTEKANQLLGKSFWSKVWLSIIAVIFFLGLSKILFDDFYTFILSLILLLTAIINSFSIHFILPFRALNRFEIETKASLIHSVIFVLCMAILLFFDPSLLQTAIAFFLIRIINLGISLSFTKRFLGLFFKHIKGSWKYLISNSPFAIHLILGTLYFQIDTILIQRFLGNEEVGYYQAAMRFIIGSLTLMDALSQASLPKISRSFMSHKELINLSKSINEKAIMLGSTITLFLAYFNLEIIYFFYDVDFSESVQILWLLSIVVFLRYLTTIYGVIITVIDKQKIRALISLIALILSVLFNVIFIPIMGIKGAILSLILTSSLILLLYILISYMTIKDCLLSKKYFSILIITVFGWGLTCFNVNLEIRIIIILILSCFYLGVLLKKRTKEGYY
ncbi:flippase [Siminovitchia acidinfaciens]|uniref:Flippase n=1 Tax=Siminovitchia acidinfaciens TaxID=2321395 RepID=A0A429XZH2_9BACI|nr:flippase [Siminovitchia acidinfaciens]RST74172.1 flippase [Siminovitchia acidinfaciens]